MSDFNPSRDTHEAIEVNIVLPDLPAAERAALAKRIVDALRADPTIRAAIRATGGAAAEGFPRYMRLSELQAAPPPAGVPFFNEDIGVLTVVAPAERPAEAVRAAIRDVPGADAVQLEAAVLYGIPERSQSGRD